MLMDHCKKGSGGFEVLEKPDFHIGFTSARETWISHRIYIFQIWVKWFTWCFSSHNKNRLFSEEHFFFHDLLSDLIWYCWYLIINHHMNCDSLHLRSEFARIPGNQQGILRSDTLKLIKHAVLKKRRYIWKDNFLLLRFFMFVDGYTLRQKTCSSWHFNISILMAQHL